MQEKITNLEIRISYLENTIDELNDVVTKQQDHIDLLIREVMRVKQQVDQGSEFVRPLSEETPPPHY